MNILSLINQCLDNYYQIKIKLLRCYTVFTMHQLWYLNRPQANSLIELLYVVVRAADQAAPPAPYEAPAG
jgi:hypothetical protein